MSMSPWTSNFLTVLKFIFKTLYRSWSFLFGLWLTLIALHTLLFWIVLILFGMLCLQSSWKLPRSLSLLQSFLMRLLHPLTSKKQNFFSSFGEVKVSVKIILSFSWYHLWQSQSICLWASHYRLLLNSVWLFLNIVICKMKTAKEKKTQLLQRTINYMAAQLYDV